MNRSQTIWFPKGITILRIYLNKFRLIPKLPKQLKIFRNCNKNVWIPRSPYSGVFILKRFLLFSHHNQWLPLAAPYISPSKIPQSILARSRLNRPAFSIGQGRYRMRYYVMLLILSFLGSFGNGLGLLRTPVDLILIALGSRSRLNRPAFSIGQGRYRMSPETIKSGASHNIRRSTSLI